MPTVRDCQEIQKVLHYIDPTTLSDQEWEEVGMGLHLAGFDSFLWFQWNMQDEKRFEKCEEKWKSFRSPETLEKGITLRTILKLARERGYNNYYSFAISEDGSLPGEDGDSEVNNLDSSVFTPPEIKEREIDFQFRTLSAADQTIKFLETLYKEDDFLALNQGKWDEKEEKYIPASDYLMMQSSIVRLLKKDKSIIADIPFFKDKGVYFRENPIKGPQYKSKDGTFESDSISDYRYCLVECEGISLEKQYGAFCYLNLPIAALIYSEKQPLQALVKVNASSEEEYDQRIKYIHNIFVQYNIPIKESNNYCNHLARLAGTGCPEEKQELVALNMGSPSYEDWQHEAVFRFDPDGIHSGFRSFLDLYEKKIDQPRDLLSGLLKKGGELMISAPSKSGKSTLVMELTFNLASGNPFLDLFKCEKSKVLYVDAELRESTLQVRMKEMLERMVESGKIKASKTHEVLRNIYYLAARGKGYTLETLKEKVVQIANMIHADAIILDPLYSLLSGDENNNMEMRREMNIIHEISASTGCSVISNHHFSKSGKTTYDEAMYRASGSGVFSRAVDAMLTLTPAEDKEKKSFVTTKLQQLATELKLDMTTFSNKPKLEDWKNLFENEPSAQIWLERYKKGTMYKAEYIVREFPDPREGQKHVVFYEYPLHILYTEDNPVTDNKREEETQERLKNIVRIIEEMNEDLKYNPRAVTVTHGHIQERYKARFGKNIPSSTLTGSLEILTHPQKSPLLKDGKIVRQYSKKGDLFKHYSNSKGSTYKVESLMPEFSSLTQNTLDGISAPASSFKPEDMGPRLSYLNEILKAVKETQQKYNSPELDMILDSLKKHGKNWEKVFVTNALDLLADKGKIKKIKDHNRNKFIYFMDQA